MIAGKSVVINESLRRLLMIRMVTIMAKPFNLARIVFLINLDKQVVCLKMLSNEHTLATLQCKLCTAKCDKQ